MSGPLVCPRCAAARPPTERFCPGCGMPLVPDDPSAAEPALSERQERVRKIKPQYSEGELVRVAGGRNQAEAELIAGMLLEEGIPSLVRRSAGFDVPDMLAAGQRDVLVPASGAGVAREVLLEAELVSPAEYGGGPDPLRLLGAVAGAVAFVALLVWAGTELVA